MEQADTRKPESETTNTEMEKDSPTVREQQTTESSTTSRETQLREDSAEEEPDDKPAHLLVVDYESQPERKRSEYRLDKYDGDVEKLTGLVRVVRGEGFYELFDEIQSTADNSDHVSAYELDPVSGGDAERTEQFSRIYDVPEDRLNWAIESLLDRLDAIRRSETEHRVATAHGDVKLRYQIDPNVSESIQLSFWLTGTGTAPKALKEEVLGELEHMLPDPME